MQKYRPQPYKVTEQCDAKKLVEFYQNQICVMRNRMADCSPQSVMITYYEGKIDTYQMVIDDLVSHFLGGKYDG